MLNDHSKVSIAQIAFFAPAAIAAISLLLFRRAIRELPRYPWIVVIIFTLIRVAGGIVVILYENQPSSTGLLVATLVLLNVGVFPCIAATIGFLHAITYIDFRNSKMLDRAIVGSRLLFIAGLAVIITGGSLSGDPSSAKTATTLVRAGYCIIAVFVGFLLLFQAFFWSRKSLLSQNSILILRGTSLAMPFFAVRLTYAFLSIYRSDETWNSLTGPAAPFILMALLMEYCVVMIYLYTGFSMKSPKRDSAPNDLAELLT